MANPERDTVYSKDDLDRTVYTRESSGTGWFIGIIVALALLAIGYLVFSANSGPSTSTMPASPQVTSPVADPAATAAPMTEAPATPTMAPATEAPAPATDAAPVVPAPAEPATPAPAAP